MCKPVGTFTSHEPELENSSVTVNRLFKQKCSELRDLVRCSICKKSVVGQRVGLLRMTNQCLWLLGETGPTSLGQFSSVRAM